MLSGCPTSSTWTISLFTTQDHLGWAHGHEVKRESGCFRQTTPGCCAACRHPRHAIRIIAVYRDGARRERAAELPNIPFEVHDIRCSTTTRSKAMCGSGSPAQYGDVRTKTCRYP